MENENLKIQRATLCLPRGESNPILTKCENCQHTVSATEPQGKMLFDASVICYECALQAALNAGNQKVINGLRAAIVRESR